MVDGPEPVPFNDDAGRVKLTGRIPPVRISPKSPVDATECAPGRTVSGFGAKTDGEGATAAALSDALRAAFGAALGVVVAVVLGVVLAEFLG